ncbi:MAG: hypothetical protein KDG89_04035 [Geminicoccaceae bacterium]|nr:hypothetical protein [Geminicoccaceae bacterium]
MQLLMDFPATDAAWNAAFDADAENRANAGLTLLQMWRGADDVGAVTCLFEVANRDRAQAWLDTSAALGRPGVARFLTTA